jgi:hypothetical protein
MNVIDEIRARPDTYESFVDVATLLAILDKVAELPDKWDVRGGIVSSPLAREIYRIASEELRAKLEQKP